MRPLPTVTHPRPAGGLAPFPVPVHFVFRGRKAAWPDLFDGSPLPDPDTIPERIVEVEECWIPQTFLRLHHAGLRTTISDRIRDDAINVVSYHDLAIRDFPINAYLVVTQHDGPRPEICDLRVVQNELNVLGENDHFIPHWPQPGLVPRDPSRGDRIESLVFKGSEANLYHAFRTQQFIDDLAAEGLTLQYDVKETATDGDRPRWHHYGESDLVLAVRDATEGDLKIKPASKLVNAWLAGCPALLGPEPAFRALRRGELDFFEVRTPAEAIAAVRRLRAEPDLFRAMIKNGFTRGQDFSHPRVTALWHGLLAGSAAVDFRRRRAQGILRRTTRWPMFAARALLQKRNRRIYENQRDHGYRPISNRYT